MLRCHNIAKSRESVTACKAVLYRESGTLFESITINRGSTTLY